MASGQFELEFLARREGGTMEDRHGGTMFAFDVFQLGGRPEAPRVEVGRPVVRLTSPFRLRTSFRVKSNHPVVVGASQVDTVTGALIVIVTVSPVEEVSEGPEPASPEGRP